MKTIIAILCLFIGFVIGRKLQLIANRIARFIRPLLKRKKYRLQISRKTLSGQDCVMDGDIEGLYLKQQYQQRPFIDEEHTVCSHCFAKIVNFFKTCGNLWEALVQCLRKSLN
jgi:hypothetical protein